jgi:hypothetical protein
MKNLILILVLFVNATAQAVQISPGGSISFKKSELSSTDTITVSCSGESSQAAKPKCELRIINQAGHVAVFYENRQITGSYLDHDYATRNGLALARAQGYCH